MRKKFEMNKEEHAELMKACQPTTCIMVGGVLPRTPQQNANDAWKRLADKLGFVWDTVEPVVGTSELVFTAEVQDVR